MKYIALASILLLTSCKTPEQNARLSAIVNLALNVAERRGAITSQDAQDVRDAKAVILDPVTVTAPSGK